MVYSSNTRRTMIEWAQLFKIFDIPIPVNGIFKQHTKNNDRVKTFLRYFEFLDSV